MARNIFGSTALESAASYGNLEAFKEVVRQGRPSQLELSRASKNHYFLGEFRV